MDGASALLILILIIVVGGLVTGALARWLLPGPDPMSLPKTILYGIAGSALGAVVFDFVSRAVALPAGIQILFSVGGAVLLIWFFRRRR